MFGSTSTKPIEVDLGTLNDDVTDIQIFRYTAPILVIGAKAKGGSVKTFKALIRVDTPEEVSYYKHGGILQYVLRQMLE